MNRKEFIKRVAKALRENKSTKTVPIPKRKLTITDETGRSHDLSISSVDRNVQYTSTDVETIIDACIAILEDGLKHGEAISFHGIGTLELRYRAPRMTKIPGTDEWAEVPGHYSPKFTAGNNLRADARIYEASLNDGVDMLPPPIYDEYEEEDD